MLESSLKEKSMRRKGCEFNCRKKRRIKISLEKKEGKNLRVKNLSNLNYNTRKTEKKEITQILSKVAVEALRRLF